MSAFAMEHLEGRQLFSASFTAESLLGLWQGTATIKQGGGNKEVILFDTAISVNSSTSITINPPAPLEFDNPETLTGTVKKNGKFDFSNPGQDPTVTVTGKISKSKGQETIKMTVVIASYVGNGTQYFDYTDSLTLVSPIPILPTA